MDRTQSPFKSSKYDHESTWNSWLAKSWGRQAQQRKGTSKEARQSPLMPEKLKTTTSHVKGSNTQIYKTHPRTHQNQSLHKTSLNKVPI